MRLVDIDAIKLPEGFFEKVDNVPKFYDWLNSFPPIEAEPVRHGRWEDNPHKMMGECPCCSECGSFNPIKYRYCPNCGAKMDGGKDDGRQMETF